MIARVEAGFAIIVLAVLWAGGARADVNVDADLTESSAKRSSKKDVEEEKVVLEEDEDEDDASAPPEEKVVLEERVETAPPSSAAPSEPGRGAKSHSAWLQLGLVQDLTFVSGTEMCSPASQIDGRFTCLRASGSQYHGTPIAGSAGKASTPAFGPTRAVVTVAFPLGRSVSLATRVGYAFAGQGPTPDGGKKFLPLLLEAQGHYWFAGEAFSTESPGAFLMLAGGIAQVDARASVTVREDPTVPPPVNQLDNPPSQRLDAWQKAGIGFVSAGAGAFVPLGGRLGLVMDVKAGVMFPASAFAMSGALSIALGL